MFRKTWPISCRMAAGALLISMLLGISRALDGLLSGHSLFLLLGGVIFCALYGGMHVGVVTAILAASAHSYFYQSPRGELGIHSTADAFQLCLFLLVAIFLSWIGNLLRKARLEAEQAIRAREDLLAVVSHDLKNPLTAIRMNAELIARRSLGDPAADPRLPRNIISIVDQMTRMVSDLLDFEKIRAGRLTVQLKVVPAASLISSAINLLQPLASQKSLKLVGAAAPDLRIRCDPDRILQVFSNLIGNAIKFTPPGGQIEIGAETASDLLHFFVKDNGTGIPENQLPHIFDRYWQAGQTAGQGTGLGLSIARGIIEAHHGQIRAESEPGKGSTFHFTLPLEVRQPRGVKGLRTNLERGATPKSMSGAASPSAASPPAASRPT